MEGACRSVHLRVVAVGPGSMSSGPEFESEADVGLVAEDRGKQREAELFSVIARDAVIFGDTAEIRGESDDTVFWILDLRRCMFRSDFISLVGVEFWERFENQFPFQIGGIESASVPIVTSILIEGHRRGHDVSGFMVRKQRKATGLRKRIEGTLIDDRIVVVDDIFNSATSMQQVAVALEEEGRRIWRAFVLVDYRTSGGKTWARSNGAIICSLFELTRFGLPNADRSRAHAGRVVIGELWRRQCRPQAGRGCATMLEILGQTRQSILVGRPRTESWGMIRKDNGELCNGDWVEEGRKLSIVPVATWRNGMVFFDTGAGSVGWKVEGRPGLIGSAASRKRIPSFVAVDDSSGMVYMACPEEAGSPHEGIISVGLDGNSATTVCTVHEGRIRWGKELFRRKELILAGVKGELRKVCLARGIVSKPLTCEYGSMGELVCDEPLAKVYVAVGKSVHCIDMESWRVRVIGRTDEECSRHMVCKFGTLWWLESRELLIEYDIRKDEVVRRVRMPDLEMRSFSFWNDSLMCVWRNGEAALLDIGTMLPISTRRLDVTVHAGASCRGNSGLYFVLGTDGELIALEKMRNAG